MTTRGGGIEVVRALPHAAALATPSGALIELNQPWRDLCTGADDDVDRFRVLGGVRDEERRTLADGGTPESTEVAHHLEDRPCWLRRTVHPIGPAPSEILILLTDITPEVQLGRRLLSERVIAIDVTPEGALTWASPGWSGLRNRDVAEELGEGWLSDTPEGQVADLRRRLTRRHPFVMERLVTTDDTGRRHVLQASFTRNVLEDGQDLGWLGLLVDLSRIHRLVDVAFMASLDPLTGFHTRPRLEEWVAATVGPLGVIFLDLDQFKSTNDQLGHAAGDIVLRESASRIRSAVRPDDMVGRMGGDEFVVVVEADDVPASLDLVASRIVSAFRRPIVVGDAMVSQSVSLGLASRQEGESVTALLTRADRAMYRAKAIEGSAVSRAPDGSELQVGTRIDLDGFDTTGTIRG